MTEFAIHQDIHGTVIHVPSHPTIFHLIYDDGRVSCYLGRVIVHYDIANRILKVTRTVDGELLREEPFEFEWDAFIEKLRNFDIICNHK